MPAKNKILRMAATIKAPGVYVEETINFSPSITRVATAIPAFIGYTQKAIDRNKKNLQNKPTRIVSLLEYENFFGKAATEDSLEITYEEVANADGTKREATSVKFATKASWHIMYYALQLYFANGGGPCYIVSVGPFKDPSADLLLNELNAGLKALEKEDEPTLIVFPESQKMKEAEYYTLQNSALDQCLQLGGRFCIMDVFYTGELLLTSVDVHMAVNKFRSGIRAELDRLRYGAAYFPNIATVFPYIYDETKVNIKHSNGAFAGVFNNRSLKEVADINTPIYNILKSALDNFYVVLPPAAAIAGGYNSVDSVRGVWKAPANISLNAVSGLTFTVTNDIQDFLNIDPVTGKSINCLRAFTGKGVLVWGARTLAGNDNEWRYVPIRRLFNMVEESCKRSTKQFVFEPNEANTWLRVRTMIENFLTVIWREGALAGAKPEQAFYVACGLNKTMTAQDILAGKMIVEIGMAAVRPAEFIILRFSHNMQKS